MTLALAAAPSPGRDVARWILNRLGPELWEADALYDTAILRNRHGHEIFLQAQSDGLTLAAHVNLAVDDDIPLSTIQEVHPLPAGPDDPVLGELLDAIRYRLAPAYGRQSVTHAVAVLAAPLLTSPSVLIRTIDTEAGRAVIDIGHCPPQHRVTITHAHEEVHPRVGLTFQDLTVSAAQDVVRAALMTGGRATLAPYEAAHRAPHTMIAITHEQTPSETATDNVADAGHRSASEGPSICSTSGLPAGICDGLDARVKVSIDPLGVESATAVLYAYTGRI
jgi:hypothetical protein